MKKDYFLGVSEEGFHKVAYTEWGIENPNPIPVICVHGLTRNGRDFDYLANQLSTHGRHLYCPDIVGRGDSDWLKNPLLYTYEQYIADMTALIARTQATQIDWIGTSMGGIIGMILASLPNSPIRRLVLNDVGAQIPAQALARLAKYAGHDPLFSSFNEAKAYFKVIYEEFGNLSEAAWDHLTETSIKEIAPGQFATKLDQGIKRSLSKSKIAWNLVLNPHKALEGTFFDVDLWHIWRALTCPVLIIHGKRSDILLPETINKMLSIHPGTTLHEVETAGHAPALLDSDQCDLIDRWLL